RIARRGVDARFVSRWVGVCRDEKASKFSLWDAYVYADFVTYPSLQEGWGNQFLEAVWAKRPIAVFEYPVFRTDIAPLGFRYVSLGREVQRGDDGLVHVPRPILQRAAAEVAHLFSHPKEYEKVVRHNFALGRAFFSLDVLAAALDKLIREMLNVG
ncbi:MAG: glycosyl transferase family 1, partial [Candidatus Brockarchaeota archaeon]|nr:glycosyl transferase family 1 [Candidatus Brockarchaeota archaeon]